MEQGSGQHSGKQMSDAWLQIEDMSVTYAGTSSPAVEQFSLQLLPGQIVSLVGESGSGKTTVIRALHGTLSGGGRVTDGTIRWQGEDLLSYDEKRWRAIRGTQISMIFQDTGLMMDPIRTIGNQLGEYIREHRNTSRKEAYRMGIEEFRKVRLPDPDRIMKSYPFELSGGQQQRVGIAFAMVLEPKLLLADEPTSALDVTTQAQIVRQMMRLRERSDTAILLITHNLALAAYMSDLILVMKQGKVVERGSRDEILKAPKNDYTRKLLKAVPVLGANGNHQ